MFETLTLDAALYIVRNMRPENRESMMQGLPDMSPETFAINRWQTDGAAWALFQDGVPVAMGGIAMALPWLGVAWFVVASGINRNSWKKLLRFSRRVFANARKTIPRIEDARPARAGRGLKHRRQGRKESNRARIETGRTGN